MLRLEAEYVSCFGSGTISEDLAKIHNSPFAVESAHIKFKDSDLSAYVYRSLFDTARQYRESFEVYGSKKSFEWPLIEGEHPVIHTAKKPEPEIPERVETPDYAHLLPEEIQSFTGRGVYDAGDKAHLSFVQGGGHGGSHPHLAHELISAPVSHTHRWPETLFQINLAENKAQSPGSSPDCLSRNRPPRYATNGVRRAPEIRYPPLQKAGWNPRSADCPSLPAP